MERHGIDEREAFERLREHARSRNRTVVDVAASVAEGHALLPRGATIRRRERGEPPARADTSGSQREGKSR